MSIYTIVGPLTDIGGLDELEPLWSELHRHHQQVASYTPLVADVAVSWSRRRKWYESLLAEGGSYFTARTAEEKVVGYLLASVTPGETIRSRSEEASSKWSASSWPRRHGAAGSGGA